MIRSTSWTARAARLRGRVALLGALAAATLAGACTERIDSGNACPALCPTENSPVRDTVLTGAVVLDTTLAGFPLAGNASYLLLATHPAPDSIDVRAIVRFDSVPARFFPAGAGDSAAITRVDSSFLRLRVDTTSTRFAQAVTIEAYDVDTLAAVDTSTAALSALFRPARLLGSVTIAPGGITGDSLRVPISNAAVAARAGRSLRVGLRVRSAGAAQLRLATTQSGSGEFGARLSFDPATDTLYRPLVVSPVSVTPGEAAIAQTYRDFNIVARGARAAIGTDLVVGGAPARRAFLRFVVPTRLIDSATIVRASLQLVQRPAVGLDRTDTVVVRPDVVLANASVTDLVRAAALAGSGTGFSIDSLKLSPADSGLRELSLVGVVRAWRTLPAGTQRALVLRAALEGGQAGELRFYSTEAGSAALRPRLRISYIPRTEFGIP